MINDEIDNVTDELIKVESWLKLDELLLKLDN
jgi:hypothetical protein